MSPDYSKLAQSHPAPKWDHTPEQVISIAKELIAKEKSLNDKIAAIQDPTIENVFLPIAYHSNDTALLEHQITFYQHVSTSKELRDALTEAEQLLQEAGIEQNMRTDVYQVFNKLYQQVVDSTSLDPETKRYLDKINIFYIQNGLHLPEDKRNVVKDLKTKLSNLSTEFSKNLNEEKGSISFTANQLDGVPKDVIDQFKIQEGGEDGKETLYQMTFKYPDIIPVLKYAKDQETRKTAYLGDQNKALANAGILEEMIRLRFKLAKTLGYLTYADYALQERMAKNQENVLTFLNDLKSKLTSIGRIELNKLIEFKNKELESRGIPSQPAIYNWDNFYYNNLLLEKEYNVDHQKISEYFPMEKTIKKMFGFYEHLFDAKFVETTTSSSTVWHEDVKQYAVFQDIAKGTPQFMGWLLLDLHPREGKYGHAANFTLGPGYFDEQGNRVTPVTSLVCNFTKPSSEKPSLLKHNEVTTFFHELGHGVHNLLSVTKYSRFHGTRVERDFVETPSQMLEFWTWSKDELKNLSSHYKTNEPLDDTTIDQLIRSKNVNKAIFNLNQLFYGLFDMTLHTVATEAELEKVDLTKLWNELREQLTGIQRDNNDTKGYASFGHIAGGYQAGYYGYLYSQVFANDIYYTLFKKEPMNVDNGLRYRDAILRRGGSKDIMDCLTELLEREPNSDAFLEELLGAQ
ncbi:uncharacterized protein KQ657_003257 [Scheffersomyces spartinae]|uniref:Peptidase M3A/M3B catalytic domain-containing protein n=1 Tax=Scheffersomyces spartinae TaxID=45513 RepID=A0A9P7VCS6_9ASCO|nr:uncharacterized protein KQ657_003257 [Scheffersomyces spartinae]KAG7195494.1 hypothetical protein KQ657_003257 [Scheffersomyces spartinae]